MTKEELIEILTKRIKDVNHGCFDHSKEALLALATAAIALEKLKETKDE